MTVKFDSITISRVVVEYFTLVIVFLTLIVGWFCAFPIIFSKPLDWYYGPISVWGLMYVLISILISYVIVDQWLRVSLEKLNNPKP